MDSDAMSFTEDNYIVTDDSSIMSGSTNEKINDMSPRDIKGPMLKLLLTNARSLAPKYKSFLTNVEEREIDIAVVTESWLMDGAGLDEDVRDLELGSGIALVYKNRRAKQGQRRRTACGGVVIAYPTKKCKLKERKVGGNVFELVAAEGTVEGVPRKVVIYGIYVPPQTRKETISRLCSVISEDISKVKTKNKDPAIFLMGDFNRKDMRDAYSVHAGFWEVESANTRGNEKLDVVVTNVDSRWVQASVHPPLETDLGTKSDHGVVVVGAEIKSKKNFEWVKVRARKRTKKSTEAYVEELNGIDWTCLAGSTEEMVATFHGILDGLTNMHFPVQTFKRRSNSDPWMTNGIRRRLKKERRIFRIQGKTTSWKAHKKETLRRIAEKKHEFVESASEHGTAAFYRAVKHLSTKDGPQRFDIMSLFPHGDEMRAATEIRDYFGEVASGFEALGDAGATTTNFRTLTPHEVEVRIKKARKPKSGIPGDIPPDILMMCKASLSRPLAAIYNQILRHASWPSQWKKEYITVIPKTGKPENLGQCRNISCTNFWSKLLEGVLLDRLREEIPPDPMQFGGLPGCGAPHFLATVWDEVLSTLEDPDMAASLCSIDFSKAFNRMAHAECLDQLRQLGASEDVLKIIRSFLTDRAMVVTVGNATAEELHLRGGSPQGSILGSYLYCATTQQLGPGLVQEDGLSWSSLGNLGTPEATMMEGTPGTPPPFSR